MSGGRPLRFVTWNVHHCAGLDGRTDPERIARVLAALDADVIALQELDIGQNRTRGVDQPHLLASALGMERVFCKTMQCGVGEYGHALLSRFPIDDVARIDLPTGAQAEPRAALSVRLSVHGRSVIAVATHLGLRSGDRTHQSEALSRALAACDEPAVLLGDLNAGPGQPGYDGLAQRLIDPLMSMRRRARATWPAPWPLKPLDHVLLDARFHARMGRVVGDGSARFASDHRPVLIEAVLE